MSPTVWTLIVLLLAVTGVVLPLLPALVELKLRHDAEPLRVVRRQDTNVRHFAESFHRRVEDWLMRNAPPIPHTAQWGANEIVRIQGGGATAVLPEELARGHVNAVLILTADAELPGQVIYEQEIYGRSTVSCRATATLRAAYAVRSLHLGPHCSVARWAHAGARLTTAPGCQLFGRATADERITLAEGVEFERLHAPIIRCGEPVSVLAVERAALAEWHPTGGVALSAGTSRLGADCDIPSGTHLQRDLVVRGRLRVGAGARVDGALKAHGDIEVETGAVIRGALISRRSIHIGPACKIRGPVIAEFVISIAPGTIIGTPRQPTTVTAADIVVDSGVQVSGTMWAHRHGYTSQQSPRSQL